LFFVLLSLFVTGCPESREHLETSIWLRNFGHSEVEREVKADVVLVVCWRMVIKIYRMFTDSVPPTGESHGIDCKASTAVGANHSPIPCRLRSMETTLSKQAFRVKSFH
jgi:hypothetical protein